jgi:leucyl-tRNA synthetase
MSYEPYNHQAIEATWQQRWKADAIFATPTPQASQERAYILDMFPYPSGQGLHVGHLLGYTGSDVVARFSRMQGKAVLHPMGWDAFGLPAENYAIKTQVHPSISTAKNIIEFKHQLNLAGMSYDWDREINSSQPEYYRWTQWLFQLLYKRGLAYKKEGLVNWCSSCQTVLANEQVVAGRCERCSTEVKQRNLSQWYFKITDYAERLLTDLDTLDWPEKIKAMQRNWIGKSEGAKIWFTVADSEEKIEVFTTRPDTLYGATYLVVAPEHPLLNTLTTSAQQAEVQAYVEQTAKKSELERQFLTKEKSGVFTGSYAIHPLTGDKIPVWTADYVIGSYGTGAIMAVPAHDERDFAFAKTFDLAITQVIVPRLTQDAEPDKYHPDQPFTQHGTLINSGSFNSKYSEEVSAEIIKLAGGEAVTTFRLRDWLVSRQRFWGPPIPVAYDAKGKDHLIPEQDLPVLLPMTVNFAPTGQSPLVQETEWQRVIHPETGEVLQRETDTLDTFVCSSWYYLRYPNPSYAGGAFDTKAVADWLPVSTYVGGAEHAVLHLLYARFITKVLFDAGLISFTEPFQSLRNQGMILGPDHQKMSKSKGNVISPNDVISEHGADTLRTYELFMAPFEQEKPWNTKGILGVRRFLDRVWRLQERVTDTKATEAELRCIHPAIKKVTEDIPSCRFNTAIACLMETLNTLSELPTLSRASYTTFVQLLAPFAPHITEELWSRLGGSGYCSLAPWPKHDEQYCYASEIEYPVQVNGKIRARLQLPADTAEADVQAKALAHPDIERHLQGQVPSRVLVVPGKLVSIVVTLPK